MRVLTLYSEGKEQITQQRTWIGYSKENEVQELLVDVGLFLSALTGQKTQMASPKNLTIKEEIDYHLTELNRLRELQMGIPNEQ